MGGRGTKFDKRAETERKNRAADQRRYSGGGGGGDATVAAQGGGVGDDPVTFTDKVKVERDAAADARLTKIYGRKMTDTEVRRLVGAPDGAEVTVFLESSDDDNVWFDIQHPFIETQQRYLSRASNGDLELTNFYFRMKDDAPAGAGSLIFANQVSNARRMGVKRLNTYAYRNDADGYVGYYVWAVLGFDAQFSLGDLAKLETWQYDLGVRSVSDLLKIKAKSLLGGLGDNKEDGVDWWKENGWSFKGSFDLSDGSRSMQTLSDYLNRKRKGKPLAFKL